ncbi:hypothetical protein DPMN_119995 [Dreissena polymorpha]|uniref:BHLH domain-containing protein n=2 Tax=Dreissena polymorpha TaxID=45954 RepID=A0A9D4GQY1_DREPO|nr:hypothetical protein DPMN_119995 [Dreissena polymorpha]
MNHSIDKLRVLIADTITQQVAPMTRVDKADILDLTVLHLKQLHQFSVTISTEASASAYSTGFKDCLREAMTFLGAQMVTDSYTIKALSDHIHVTGAHSVPNCSERYQTIAQRHMSTPARMCDVSNSMTSSLHTPNVSPVANYARVPEGYQNCRAYRECKVNRTHTRTNICSHDSSMDSGYSSENNSTTMSGNVNVPHSDGVVSIGRGRDDEIGHVIKDILWRPF